jgi:hypothetical protein
MDYDIPDSRMTQRNSDGSLSYWCTCCHKHYHKRIGWAKHIRGSEHYDNSRVARLRDSGYVKASDLSAVMNLLSGTKEGRYEWINPVFDTAKKILIDSKLVVPSGEYYVNPDGLNTRAVCCAVGSAVERRILPMITEPYKTVANSIAVAYNDFINAARSIPGYVDQFEKYDSKKKAMLQRVSSKKYQKGGCSICDIPFFETDRKAEKHMNDEKHKNKVIAYMAADGWLPFSAIVPRYPYIKNPHISTLLGSLTDSLVYTTTIGNMEFSIQRLPYINCFHALNVIHDIAYNGTQDITAKAQAALNKAYYELVEEYKGLTPEERLAMIQLYEASLA